MKQLTKNEALRLIENAHCCQIDGTLCFPNVSAESLQIHFENQDEISVQIDVVSVQVAEDSEAPFTLVVEDLTGELFDIIPLAPLVSDADELPKELISGLQHMTSWYSEWASNECPTDLPDPDVVGCIKTLNKALEAYGIR